MNDVTVAQWGIVIGASLGAAIMDVRKRRIPNALTLPLAVAGFLYVAWQEGLGGLGQAIAACIVVSLPYVVLFVFAGGGAGDAKMMGAIGAWLGLEAGFVVLMAVAVTGGIFGILNLAARRQLRAGLTRIGHSFYIIMGALSSGPKGWTVLKPDPDHEVQPQDRRLTIPYGPAIFVGVCTGAFLVNSWNG